MELHLWKKASLSVLMSLFLCICSIPASALQQIPADLFSRLILSEPNAAVPDIIVDNRDVNNISYTGRWTVSGVRGWYGKDAVASSNGMFSWYFTTVASGDCNVFMWWTQNIARVTSAEVRITDENGINTLYVNQQANGGKWNLLGKYRFVGGTEYNITIVATPVGLSTCADAVKISYAGSSAQQSTPVAVIDSISPNPASPGQPITFTGHGLPDQYPVVQHKWTSSLDGILADANSFTLSTLSIGTHTISYQVKDEAGNWSQPVTSQILVQQVISRPVAVIDSVSPNPAVYGEMVNFQGHGLADKYPVSAYYWASDVDGKLSDSNSFAISTLSVATHNITFRVKDDANNWSDDVTTQFTVTDSGPVTFDDIIVDNTDTSSVSYTGRWTASGVKGWYGTNAVASSNGTFSWYFTPPATADCNVFLWWTQNIARSNNAEVRITDSNGIESVYVNQQANGGKWNLLGKYRFQGNTRYNITIVAVSNGYSTCADAVKISMASGTTPPPTPAFPVSAIDSITPNPAEQGQSVTFTGHGTTGAASVTAHQWTSSINGNLSTLSTFTSSSLAIGTHTVTYKVQDNLGRWSQPASAQLVVNEPGPPAEKILVFRIFSWDYLFLKELRAMLTKIGATSEPNGLTWHYTYVPTGKKYDVIVYETKDALRTALMTPGAHIVTGGHSNYGLGPAFTTAADGNSKKITAVKYVNDDRFLNICSDVMTTDPEGMVYGQVFPNWKPIYTNGQNAQAPTDFSGPALPPYNYYLTYKLPGDSTNYRIQLSDGTYIQRFSDTGLPAWYSSSGAKPDPVINPEYFMVYPFEDWNRCSFVNGTWSTSAPADDNTYDGFNYAYRPAGTGTRKASYNLVVLMPGQYQLRATWPALSDNASNAEYTINHALGTSVVYANQKTTQSYGSNKWNVLGTYTFDRGSYTVQLSDKADGRVIADAIELYPLSNPANVVQAEFGVDKQSGTVPLTVKFSDYSLQMAGSKSWYWNFGDGTTSSSQNPSHSYSKAGVYSITFKVTDAKGASSTEVKQSFIVVGSYTMALDAKFTAATRYGTGKVVVNFKDQSAGSPTSWNWDFGDGTTSTMRNPTHIYYTPGVYTVSLTVANASGTSTETETDYIYLAATPVFCDNATLYKPAWVKTSMSPTSTQKIAINMADYRMKPEDMKYARLFWATCSSAQYFLDTFKQGIVFCTTTSIEDYTAVDYIQNYMQGLNDADNLVKLNNIVPGAFVMVDFSKKPPSLQ